MAKCRKMGHLSERAATKAFVSSLKRGLNVKRVYHCGRCRKWHLTSQEWGQFSRTGESIGQ